MSIMIIVTALNVEAIKIAHQRRNNELASRQLMFARQHANLKVKHALEKPVSEDAEIAAESNYGNALDEAAEIDANRA